MKITVIGGGGVRSMFLAKSLAGKVGALSIDEIVFMDNNGEKLRIYGGLAKEVIARLCPSVKMTLTCDPVAAVTDADYVITTIRVGEDDMRVKDERIALSHGVLGQETTGCAGFSFAMRSIPALIRYCELIRKYAKKTVKVFNFTNPAGIVSQALRDAGYDFTYGICDAPSGMLHQFAKYVGCDPTEIEGECYGINHLSFFKSITARGENVMQSLLDSEDARKNTDLRYFEKSLLDRIKCVPNEYLYYFYYREKAIKNILDAEMTRGELIADVNKKMTEELSPLDPHGDFDRCKAIFEKWYGYREAMYMAKETGIKRGIPFTFDIYSPETGGYAGVALRFIELRESGKEGNMILCLPNGDAIEELAPTDVVEVSVTIKDGEAVPHKMRDLPLLNTELIRRVKLYERLGAKAILNDDFDLAVDALTVHPLVNSYSLAKELMTLYVRHNKDYI